MAVAAEGSSLLLKTTLLLRSVPLVHPAVASAHLQHPLAVAAEVVAAAPSVPETKYYFLSYRENKYPGIKHQGIF